MRLVPDASPPRGALLRASLLVFLAALLGLLAGKTYRGGGDTVPAEYQPIALLVTGRWDYTALFASEPPGTGTDPSYTGLRPRAQISPGGTLPYPFQVRKGRVVSVYPVLPGLLNVPVFAAARLAGLDVVSRRIGLSHLTTVLIASASASAFLLAAASVAPLGVATGMSIVYVFSTAVFSIAGRGLWQHGPALLFLNLSLALLLARRERLVPWAGLTLGLMVACRLPTLPLAALLALHVARNERRAAMRFALLAAVPAAALLAYSGLALGSFAALGQLQTFRPAPEGAGSGVLGLLVSPSRGLLIFGPLFLFAIPALFRTPGPPPGRPVLFWASLFVPALLLVTGLWPVWWGGHAFGYRLLTELVPILLLLIAASWRERIGPFAWRRRLFVALAVLSAGIHALGAFAPGDFDYLPDDIDRNPARLWDVRDSALPRAVRRLL